jgi:hypothetical protein
MRSLAGIKVDIVPEHLHQHVFSLHARASASNDELARRRSACGSRVTLMLGTMKIAVSAFALSGFS